MPSPVRKPKSTTPDALPVSAGPASSIVASIPTEFQAEVLAPMMITPGHSSHAHTLDAKSTTDASTPNTAIERREPRYSPRCSA